MDHYCENMDGMCVWLESLLLWVDRVGIPRIPYLGWAVGRLNNAPAQHLELCFVAHGALTNLRIGSLRAELPAGHVSLHSVHFGNRSNPADRAESWCVFFDVTGLSAFNALGDEPFFSAMSVAHTDRLVSAFRTLSVRRNKPDPERPWYPVCRPAWDPARDSDAQSPTRVLFKAALLELLGTTLMEARASPAGPAEQTPPVRQAIEFIIANYGNPALDLKRVAAAAHLSVSHFGRLFRQETGTTPVHYLQRMRIAQARLLLEQTMLRVSEVARSVGFSDPLHFSRAFRTETGKCPREYRRDA